MLHAALATPEQRPAFERFVDELLRVLTHSILVTIDGGTEYSDAHGTLQLLHGDGQPFGEALRELFIDHLLDTGRCGQGRRYRDCLEAGAPHFTTRASAIRTRPPLPPRRLLGTAGTA